MRRDSIYSLASFLFGLFAIPILVFTGGSVPVGAAFGLVAIGTVAAAMRTDVRSIRAFAWAGFVMGVAGLWYAVTGWAVSLDIAASIESLL